MFRGFRKYVVVVIMLLLFVPISVFADEDENTFLNDTNNNILNENNNLLNQENDSILNQHNNLNLEDNQLNNTSLDMVGSTLTDIETIKNIIGDNISVDLLECQSYDYDESNNSVLNTEVENSVKDKLVANNFDYDSLGYSFSADFVNYNDFSYDGTIRIFQNGIYVDQIFATITYLNTDDHNEVEQAFVNDFIDNNDFTFEKEFYLDDYFDQGFDLNERLNSFADQFDIECSSMYPLDALVNGNYPFACFYNHKYYGKVFANLNKIVKVKVPSNISNASNYILDKVKEYFADVFVGYDFYYSGDIIFVKDVVPGYDFKIGTFVPEIISVPVVNPTPASVVNPTPASVVEYVVDNNSNNYYGRRYYARTYYTDYYDLEDEPVGSTLGSSDKEPDIADILKTNNSAKKLTKNTNKKATNKAKNSDNKTITDKKVEEDKEKDNNKMSATKVLFIIVAGISLAGIVIAIINKIIINSEASIDV